jgi:hypothetical protein
MTKTIAGCWCSRRTSSPPSSRTRRWTWSTACRASASIDGDGSRGFEGSVGNVLINGSAARPRRTTPAPACCRAPWPPRSNIELIRGGAPGIDMQGYSVVVNVITEEGSSRQSILTGTPSCSTAARTSLAAATSSRHQDGDRPGASPSARASRPATPTASAATCATTGPALADLRDEDFSTTEGGGRSIRGNYAGPVAGGKLDLTARYGVNDSQALAPADVADRFRRSDLCRGGSSGEFGADLHPPLGSRLDLRDPLHP